MALFLGVDTDVEWIDSICSVPILGHMFLFVLVFVPAVVLAFVFQAAIPALHNDVGFTKAMLLLLPIWNAVLWFTKIKPYILFIPTWVVFGVIAIVKGFLMYKGIDNGH